jgi:uncharacterized protein (DUF4415 family)
MTSMTSAEMREAKKRGEDRSDWVRVRREANREPAAAAMNRKLGKLISRRRGRPVVGEPKTAISLRLPQSVVERWRASGAGWQTRMVEILEKRAP